MGNLTSKGFSNICAGVMFIAMAGGVIAGAVNGTRETNSNIRANGSRKKAKANA